jgi:hypothetical protein
LIKDVNTQKSRGEEKLFTPFHVEFGIKNDSNWVSTLQCKRAHLERQKQQKTRGEKQTLPRHTYFYEPKKPIFSPVITKL